jgi:peptidoglycan L-alanyl-D-glutamate endopeptidase CwlK
MTYRFSSRSTANLAGVHPHLVALASLALSRSSVDFVITEGLRTRARQAELVAAGASRTMNSRHLTGHAIDVAALIDGQVRWDWPLYEQIARAFEEASLRHDIPVTWGGNWATLRDGPHFELPRETYPND